MPRRRYQHLTEWGLIAFMAVACALLSVLQYRWTGELSRAETAGLRASLQTRIEQVAQAFDRELWAATTALVPTRVELDQYGFAESHARHVRAWAAEQPRPVFARVMVIAPDARREPAVFSLDLGSGRLEPSTWPGTWPADLRDTIAARLRGDGRPPRLERDSWLIERPVFGEDGEREWVIFELDQRYLRETWLPDLLGMFVTTSESMDVDVEVRHAPPPAPPLYSTRRDGAPVEPPHDATARLFARRGPEMGPPRAGEPPRWLLLARYRARSLDTAVAVSRWRNLGVALLLLAMVLMAALALLRSTRRARHLAEMELTFVAGVSHELRTPLTVIRGAAHNLLTGVVRDDTRKEGYARMIIEHADQLTEMIEQLLSFASTKRRAADLRREPVSIADVLERARDGAIVDVRASGCTLEIAAAPDLPRVIGDPAALRRAFANLITNAAKHGASGNWIGVSAARATAGQPAMIEVRVSDRGPGVPDAEASQVFDPFFRGRAARSAQVRGFGLGLSLVKDIIEAHGGSVRLEPAVPHGSVFVVLLPMAPEQTR